MPEPPAKEMEEIKKIADAIEAKTPNIPKDLLECVS